MVFLSIDISILIIESSFYRWKFDSRIFLNIYTVFSYSDTNNNNIYYYTVQLEPLMIEEQLFVKQAVRMNWNKNLIIFKNIIYTFFTYNLVFSITYSFFFFPQICFKMLHFCSLMTENEAPHDLESKVKIEKPQY